MIPLKNQAYVCKCGGVMFALRRDHYIECDSCGVVMGKWEHTKLATPEKPKPKKFSDTSFKDLREGTVKL